MILLENVVVSVLFALPAHCVGVQKVNRQMIGCYSRAALPLLSFLASFTLLPFLLFCIVVHNCNSRGGGLLVDQCLLCN